MLENMIRTEQMTNRKVIDMIYDSYYDIISPKRLDSAKEEALNIFDNEEKENRKVSDKKTEIFQFFEDRLGLLKNDIYYNFVAYYGRFMQKELWCAMDIWNKLLDSRGFTEGITNEYNPDEDYIDSIENIMDFADAFFEGDRISVYQFIDFLSENKIIRDKYYSFSDTGPTY